MALRSPLTLTVPTTPTTGGIFRLSTSPMGGGDRPPSDLDSLFGSVRPPTRRGGTSSFTKRREGRRPRALRRVSPASMPLSQYSTPPKSCRYGKPLDQFARSPTVAALSQTVASDMVSLPTSSADLPIESHFDGSNSLFIGMAGQPSPDSPVIGVPGFLFGPSSPSSSQLELGYRGDGEDSDIPVDVPSFSAIDTSFLSKCKFRKFNPKNPTLTNFDILMRFGQLFGQGITRSELNQVFRQCTDCENLLYADRRSYHLCDGKELDPHTVHFDLVQALLNADANSGVSCTDFMEMTVRCDDCKRYCLLAVTHHHECPRHGQKA